MFSRSGFYLINTAFDKTKALCCPRVAQGVLNVLFLLFSFGHLHWLFYSIWLEL